MRTAQIVLGVLACLLYCSIDTIAQSKEAKDFATIDDRTGRIGVGFSVLNVDTDLGGYGISYCLDFIIGIGNNKWEILLPLHFGLGKTESDLIYLDETWAAGSRYSTSGFGVNVKYRLFDFEKIGIASNIGCTSLRVGPKSTDIEKYPGLKKYGSYNNYPICVGVSIRYLLPSKLSAVSLSYLHFINTNSKSYDNKINLNSNKLTLQITFAAGA